MDYGIRNMVTPFTPDFWDFFFCQEKHIQYLGKCKGITAHTSSDLFEHQQACSSLLSFPGEYTLI